MQSADHRLSTFVETLLLDFQFQAVPLLLQPNSVTFVLLEGSTLETSHEDTQDPVRGAT